jgi:hypothetical protein
VVTGGAPRYQQHRPEETPLHGIVREHLESFLAYTEEQTGKRLPRYVEGEFNRYVKCGIAAHGFARAVCSTCGHSLFVAFSCKLRGVCPSCNARRMCDTAAHVVDHVLPDVRLRQWVLSVPFELRLLLASNPQALSQVGRIFCREIVRWQEGVAATADGFDGSRPRARGGAICFVQRFGGSLNLNVHYHVVVPDAVFEKAGDDGRARVIDLPAPRGLDLEEIVTAVAGRVVRWLGRHGHLGQSEGEADESTPLQRCLEGALGIGELHADPSAKKPARSPTEIPAPRKGLVGEHSKFNIHAGVSVEAGCPSDRERLLRYCARAPLSLERLRVLDDGRIAYQVRHAYRGGAALRIMTPMQFMARLAALIPPPRHPLIRFHGVFAPNSKWRSTLVRERAEGIDAAAPPCVKGPESVGADVGAEEAKPKRRERVGKGLLPDTPTERPTAILTRTAWATLLKRVHDVDALACQRCGGRMRFVELVEDPRSARELLADAGMSNEPLPLARARAPDWDEN